MFRAPRAAWIAARLIASTSWWLLRASHAIRRELPAPLFEFQAWIAFARPQARVPVAE